MRRVFRLRRLEASIGRIEFCLVVILLCLGTTPEQEDAIAQVCRDATFPSGRQGSGHARLFRL